MGQENKDIEGYQPKNIDIDGYQRKKLATPTFGESRRETVNHPDHYGGDTTYEVIKVLEAWGLDRSFCLGNAVKYIARAGKKEGAKDIEDLKKALWYLSREITKMEDLRSRPENQERL